MAEGGEFGCKDPVLEYNIDHHGADDKQEVNTTFSFGNPRAASTPYHSGEQVQTIQHEQTGLQDTSYSEKTPLLQIPSTEDIEKKLNLLKDSVTGIYLFPEVPLEQQEQIQKAKDFIKKRYPNVDFSKLVIRYGKKPGNIKKNGVGSTMFLGTLLLTHFSINSGVFFGMGICLPFLKSWLHLASAAYFFYLVVGSLQLV